ncbi:MAG: hypothetical protein ACOCXM_03590 [Myxococcota bacterium]
MKRLMPALMGLFVILCSQGVSAEAPEQRVLELNRSAMEAYMSLDIERAKEQLLEALTIAEREGVTGRPLARTYVNLGVVTVGGEDDLQSAFEFFKAALTEDPSIRPDPAASTPEVDEAFHLAKGRHRTETGHTSADGDPTPEEVEARGAEEDPEPGAGDDAAGSEPEATGDRSDWGARRRTFLHVGFTLGAASANPGKPADSAPPAECFDDDGTLLPGCGGYVPPGRGSCDGSEFCTRVEKSGVLPAFAVTATAGYYVVPRLALALSARIGFPAGEGTLSQLMLAVRAQYAFVEPEPEGANFAGFAGASVGQIQVQPDQGNNGQEPFISSGLGSVQIGAVIGYRFLPSVGFVLTPQAHLFFPTFMVAAEATAGLELAF